MTVLWDAAFLKSHERDARRTREAAQSDGDWQSAELLLERAMSDASGGWSECALPACRRALRCVGNRPICMPRCAVALVPGAEQELFEELYAEIQQERCDAAGEDRAPYVIGALTHRVHQARVPRRVAPAPVSVDVERKISIVAPSLPGSVAASVPQPQQLLQTSPPAAPPETPPPPPKVEEQVNRSWAPYAAAPEAFAARRRCGPRIRSVE